MNKFIASTAAAVAMLAGTAAPSHAWVGHIFYHGVGAASTAAVGAMSGIAGAVIGIVDTLDDRDWET